MSLPIDVCRPAFEAALRTSKPVVVSAPTGSGKSTRLPSWLADAGCRRVLVIEPRRIAARQLAQWVADGRDTPLGGEVGYQVRFEGRHDAHTRILFVTPGVGLSMLADPSAATRFDAILVDEFHERAWETDLLVTLARRRRQRDPTLRLVLCSATLAEEELVAALDGVAVRGEGRAFPVEIRYDGDGGPSDRDLAPRIAAAVASRLAEPDGEGDVLAFLPGKREIAETIAALGDLAIPIVAVHGGIAPAKLAAALRPSSQRRIFVATNVAETSLTLPGVRTVIDSGLARMRLHQAGHSVLGLVPISAASAQQRAGRAGRVAPGVCVRLWSRHYQAEPHTRPEIVRVELDALLVRAASAGLTADAILDAPWVTAPPAFAVQAARRRLEATGDLDASGALTEAGRRRARLPVSAWSARVLGGAPPDLAGCLADLIGIVEGGRDLLLPGAPTHAPVEEARAALFAGARDEVEVLLRALWAGDASAHGLHAGALAEARAIARQLRDALGIATRRDSPPALDRSAVAAHLLTRVPESAFVPRTARPGRRGRGRPSGRAWGNGSCEITMPDYVVAGLPPDQQPSPPAAAVVMQLQWLGVGRRAQGRGRMAMACTPADLLAAALGDADVGPPMLKRSGERLQVWADAEIRYAGVILSRERVRLRGDPLRRGIATLIADDRWPELDGNVIADRYFVDALLTQLSGTPTDDAPDLRSRLAERLATLGVTEEEDVGLLELDELCPDLDARAHALGIDPREPTALATDFPRRWSYDSVTYACRVQIQRRVVELTPVRSGKQSKGREPPAKVLPRFRGFAVQYRKASRCVQLR